MYESNVHNASKTTHHHLMKEIKEILPDCTHGDGLKVPEGYFEDFADRLSKSLPDRPELKEPTIVKPRTMWQHARPYVYLAAMFAGVWCMLKMFTMMTQSSSEISFENDPILSEAGSNEVIVNDIIDDISPYEFYNEYSDFELAHADSFGIDIDTSMVYGLVMDTTSTSH